MTTTAEDIIVRAYKHVGIDDPTDDEKTHALNILNDMLDSWNAQQFLIYVPYTRSFTLTVNKYEYTIGSGGDFDTTRPKDIVSAYIRDSNDEDHQLEQITVSEYDNIEYKFNSGRPDKFVYLSEYPLGKIIFNKKPSEAESVYFTLIQPLESFSSLTEAISLPSGYRRALRLNLAVELAIDQDVKMIDTVYRDAERMKLILKDNNIRQIPKVEFDDVIVWCI